MHRKLAVVLLLGSFAGPAIAQPPPPPIPPPPPGPPPVVEDSIPHGEPAVVSLLPGSPKPGFYGSVDLSFLFPHRGGEISGFVPFASVLFGPTVDHRVALTDSVGTLLFPPVVSNEVRLPGAMLDGTLAPTFKIGYRLIDGRGAFQATYRNVTSEGAELIPNYELFGDGVLLSRLDINEVGLNYSTREQPLGALWAIRWEIGGRLSSIYFDSEAFGTSQGDRTTSHFLGAGPQLALDVTREIPQTGFALFSRIDGAVPIGSITQNVSKRLGNPDSPYLFEGSSQNGTQAVPFLGFQAGFSWINRPDGRYRLTAGYEFNEWWNAARLGESRGYIQAQGLFLRTEFNY